MDEKPDETPDLDRELEQLTRTDEFQALEKYAGLKNELTKILWRHEERLATKGTKNFSLQRPRKHSHYTNAS